MPMDLQHLNVKFFVDQPETVDLESFLAVFNAWIQDQVIADELLIDVADYRHVWAGPGVILIGHEANYSLDNAGNRLGLLYNRKAPLPGSNNDRLRQAVRAALLAAQRLGARPGLEFSGHELQLAVNDRLLAPNTDETWQAAQPELSAFFDQLYGPGRYSLERHPEPRERFTVDVKAEGQYDVAGLLSSLS
jgi:hypothetical protein